MRPQLKLFPALVVLLALFGAPPLAMLVLPHAEPAPPATDPVLVPAAAADAGRAALVELARSRSTLALAYDRWERGYEARGGDREVHVNLAWDRGLSTATSAARGWAKLDLLSGTVHALVRGMDAPADLWLVDNRPGPGMDSRPQPGDGMVRLGRLSGAPDSRLSIRLGDRFFDDFELDLMVVTPAGARPDEAALLFGHRSVFERNYTRARRSVEQQQRGDRLSGWLPSTLAALLSPRPAFANATSILIAHGLVSQQVGDGADLFFDGTFSGNGRTCGTCHPQENNQTIDPPFIASLPPSDLLFVASLPPEQGGVPGLERPELLRQEALILENVDGFEDPTVKFVMRGVPHSLSMITSIAQPADGRPAGERTGWGGDAGSLNGFSNGAIRQHFTKSLDRIEGTDFRLATQEELDAMEAFMLASGRLNDPVLANASLSDPAAERGRLLFLDPNSGKCAICHLDAGANAGFGGGGNANVNTGVEDLPHPARTPGHPDFVEIFPLDGGFGLEPVDVDGDGQIDFFGDGTFNITPLVEAAETGPFFHNNVLDTIELAVDFFNTDEFNQSPGGIAVGGISLTPVEVAEIAKFLRVLNAGLNVDIAVQRTEAGIALENQSSEGFGSIDETSDSVNGKRATVDALLGLANAESGDAVEVLSAVGLHPSAVTLLQSAISKSQQAQAANGSRERKRLMQDALADLNSARKELGSGFDFVVGEGNLLFGAGNGGLEAL
jgi:cytochrome c peroxidase